MESQWSSKPPVVDGYYWRQLGNGVQAHLVWVCDGFYYRTGVDARYRVGDGEDARWLGPLAPDNGGTHTPLAEAVARAARQLEDAAAGLKVLGESLRRGR